MRYSRVTTISAARAAASMSPPSIDALDVEVVAPALVDEGAAAAQSARRVDDGVERLEIDRDRVGEVFRLVARRRDAGGDRLADIAHLVGRERRPGRRFGARGACVTTRIGFIRGRSAAVKTRPRASGGTAIDRMRACACGLRRKTTCCVPGRLDVRHELAAPAEVPVILPAQQRRADAGSGLAGHDRRASEHRRIGHATRKRRRVFLATRAQQGESRSVRSR